MNAAHRTSSLKSYPPGSLMGKLKKRGILGALATMAGSGWLAYEIVHFILVDHYHLPEVLKDITIVSVLCATLCVLTWRWFRGVKGKRRIQWELILVPVFILVAGAVNIHSLVHAGRHPPESLEPAWREGVWKNSIAVLPFVNMSADKDQDYFCDGLTEELITKLSQIRDLKVTARTSAFVFRGENRDLREVGQKLGVDKVLEGSVRKDGSRLRISAQLINASNGYHLWSEIYDRDLDNIFKVQDDIAYSVAGALKITLLGKAPSSSETKNIEAYNAFLRGRHFYISPTKENIESAIKQYEEATRLDPGFARAWAALGAAQATQAGFGYESAEDGYPKAIVSVERALELDRRLASAHAVKGWILMSYRWDWDGAAASYQQALSLEPGTGALEAGQLALVLGRFDQALSLARRAVELDSLNVAAHMTLGLVAFYAGQLKEASATFKKILELSPERPNAHALLGQVYTAQSQPREGLAETEREKDPYWRLPGLALVRYALNQKKESDAALAEYINKYQDVGAYQIAQIHAFRGESDQAFEWLERAYKKHDGGLFLTKPDPYLKKLKSDPRYSIFLKKMRLPLEAP
jgi:TolB-like protein/Flp pilus assembly protein TadD